MAHAPLAHRSLKRLDHMALADDLIEGRGTVLVV